MAVEMMGSATYDLWIETTQHAVVYADSHATAQKFMAYLTEVLGYRVVGGPYPWDGKLRVDFLVGREMIADSRRGDAVAFDGRYEVRG